MDGGPGGGDPSWADRDGAHDDSAPIMNDDATTDLPSHQYIAPEDVLIEMADAPAPSASTRC